MMRFLTLLTITVMLSVGASAQTVLGFTSFEEPGTGGQYTDVSGSTTFHALVNNAGEAPVNYTSTGGELGFESFHEDDGLADGDFVGVTGFTGAVGSYTDGTQGFQMSDTDGEMRTETDGVLLAGHSNYTLTLDYFVNSTGYESSDDLLILVWDGTDTTHVVSARDMDAAFDGGGVAPEGVWNNVTFDLTPFAGSTVEVWFILNVNSGSEAVYFDNLEITGSSAAPCALNSSGVSNVQCNDNGTPLDPADDFITFDLQPSGSGLGSGWDVVGVSSGTIVSPATTTGLSYGSPTSFTMNTGSAGAGDFTISIQDADDNTCATDILVTDPGVCSTPPSCATSTTTLPYGGISGNAEFEHSSSNPPAAGPQEDCATNFLLSYAAAPGTDGSSNWFGTLSGSGLASSDWGGEATFQTFIVDVSSVTSVDVQTFGNTVGTAFNAGSEYLEWWYTVDGGAQTAINTYNTGYSGSLANGPLTVDVTGVSEIVVGFTFNINGGGDGFEDMDVTIIETPAGCSLSTAGLTGVSCDDNGTPGIDTDDEIAFTLDPTGANLGATYTVTTSSGGVTPSTGTYGSATSFTTTGALAGGGSVDVTITDDADPTCTITVTVTDPGVCSFPPLPNCSDLFFSEYVEGSSSNKCLEIYNPTGADVSLSGYNIATFNNGATTPTSGPTPLGSFVIPAYGTFVLCNAFADPGFTSAADSVGGVLQSLTFYNGDDAIVLYNGATIIDVIGRVGEDPGSSWSGSGVSTANATLRRMASVQTGDNNPSNAFDPSAEWMDAGIDVAAGLGAHDSDCAPFIWRGTTSTDWNTGANWNKGTVPTSADEVLVPMVSAPNVYPDITGTVEVTDLTVATGGEVSVAPNAVLEIGASGVVDNSGSVILRSDATGTGILDDFTNATSFPQPVFNGDVTVEMFVAGALGGDNQHFISSPVNAPNVSEIGDDLNGPLGAGLFGADGVAVTPLPSCDVNQLDVTSNYGNLFELQEDNITFCYQERWVVRSSGSLTNGEGYSAWLPSGSTAEWTGTPNTGFIFGHVVTNQFGPTTYPEHNGWNLFGNPYPSPMSIDDFLAANIPFLNSPSQYEPSGPFAGTYQPYAPGSNVAVNQGFMAISADAAYAATFTNDMRSTGPADWKSNTGSYFEHKLDIEVHGNGFADRTEIYFNEAATAEFDVLFDRVKVPSDAGQPTIATGGDLAMNGLNVEDMTGRIPVAMQPGADGSFELRFSGMETFPAGTVIYLHDRETDSYTDLRTADVYSFEMSADDASDRFELVFEKSDDEETGIDALAESGVRIFSHENVVTVDLRESAWDGLSDVVIHDLLGGAVAEAEGLRAGMHTFEVQSAGGYYFVTVTQGSERYTKQVVIIR